MSQTRLSTFEVLIPISENLFLFYLYYHQQNYHIFWNCKLFSDINKSFSDIKKGTSAVVKWFFNIRNSISWNQKTWYQEFKFLISKYRFYDIKIPKYFLFTAFSWYQKITLLISKKKYRTVKISLFTKTIVDRKKIKRNPLKTNF